jgi:hypothetical protein
MRPMVMLYVIETTWNGRILQCGCSLNKEEAERMCADLLSGAILGPYDYYEVVEYCVTDKYTTFDRF